MKKNNNNLEYFVNILIKIVETSEDHIKGQIDDIKSDIKDHQTLILKLKKQINDMKITNAVENVNGNLHTKLVISLTTLLIIASSIIVRCNADIYKYITELFK
jgi:hypothetical protein